MKHFLGDSQVLHRNGKLQEAEVAYKRAYTGPLQPWDFDPGWFCLKTGGSTSMDMVFFMANEWGTWDGHGVPSSQNYMGSG